MFSLETRILIVDDMSTVRRIVSKILKELGYNRLEMAENGQEAWDILNRSSFDLVISDWNMPVLTGIELLKLCRADSKYAKVPFILLTAEAEAVQVSDAVKSGVSNYVIKPFTGDILKVKLQQTYKKTVESL
jgi:two-component system, chemotaxis family, chemotaxis protein CheY